MSEIDDQVIKLQAKVAEKKASISKAERPTWRTNCAFQVNPNHSEIRNLQTVTDVATLVSLFAVLIQSRDAFEEANGALGTKVAFTYARYSYEDWEADFKTKVSIISLTAERAKLRKLEELLESMESTDLKKKKTLAAIEAELED